MYIVCSKNPKHKQVCDIFRQSTAKMRWLTIAAPGINDEQATTNEQRRTDTAASYMA